MSSSQRNIITIDGPAGSGKSTISRLLASKLGYAYLDTGAMYRAIALAVKRAKITINNPLALKRLCEEIDLRFVTDGKASRLLMENEDVSNQIRNPEIDMLASDVSAVKEVRESMKRLQRKIASSVKKGLVAEGRDMGTVVFPDAKFKVLLTASVEERASRRHAQMLACGKTSDKAEVLENLRKRDHQDQNRLLAPLKPAPDAFIMDTTALDIEAVLKRLIAHIAST